MNNFEEANSRGRSHSMATSYNDYLEKKKKIEKKEKEILNKVSAFRNLIEESDINLSKAITIEILQNERKKSKKIKIIFFL